MTAPKIENPFKYGEDPELNMIFDKLIALKTRVANEFAKAEKIAGFGAEMGFKPVIDGKLNLPSYTSLYENNGFRRPDMNALEKQVKDAIATAKTYVADLKEQNAPIDEHNKKVCDQVTQIMIRLGIPTTYTTYEFPSTRSRTKKSISHTAGYVGDLNRNCPKSNVSTLEYQITSYERDFEHWKKRILEQETKVRIERDTETVNKKILGNPKLVAALMLAGVNILEEVQKAVPGEKASVIEYCMATAIQNTLNRDKYLKLAHGLQLSVDFGGMPVAKTHAQDAISEFALKSNHPMDDEIVFTIDKAITDWDIRGGRVFEGLANWNIIKIRHYVQDTAARDLLDQLIELHNEL